MTTRGTQDTAIELLLAEPERLEPGLVGLDSHLKLDDNVEIDVLLRDSLGYLIFERICLDDMIRVPNLREQDSIASTISESGYIHIRVVNQIRI